ncbi:MFS transporter [Actinocrispum sp. NPDC049592]|uniref:MFS transporter n=1 Tax=Actinocrispum sp. NPDC049592 TaxID=3154835 RepID=UPI003432188D
MSAALAEPVGKVSRRWIVAFCVAVVGTFVGWYGPLQILLAKQADAFFPADKENVLALVSLLGALVSTVANPVWGALSDRTTSRLGRRLPWVIVGTVGGVAGLLVLAMAQSIGVMILGWCLVQLALNAPYAALSAAVPDQVPVAQRGTAGGYFGVAQTVGVMAGTGLAVLGGSIIGGYLACALFVLLSAVPYVLLRKDIVLTREQRPAWSWARFASGFWISPRAYPDFAWAWLTRFLINLGNALALLYLLFFLKDAVHLADPDTGVLILTVLDAVTLLVAVMVGGVWSDRLGKRRVFVVGSGVIMSLASLLLASWQTWTGAVIAAIVLGLGFGAYTSVDFALITQVLPEAADRARDLGVLNIASALPQVLAPVIAAPLVRHLGGYPALYLASALVGLAGALLVYRIKSVR